MEWGPEIVVDGVKPNWLSDDVKISFKYSNNGIFSILEDWFAHKITWEDKYAIRLPADHFAYTAIAKGFTPWGGGSEAPKDWNGKYTLTRDGDEKAGGSIWVHDGHSRNIIGYHPKPIAQPSPVDTVTITRLDEDTLACLFETYWEMHGAKDSCIKVLQFIGALPKTPTRAERIAKSTNLPLADVERVLAAIEEEG